jgi:hypothetical protein
VFTFLHHTQKAQPVQTSGVLGEKEFCYENASPGDSRSLFGCGQRICFIAHTSPLYSRHEITRKHREAQAKK